MIYLYDNALVDDLRKSFNPNNLPNPAVVVIAPEDAVVLAAQIQDDKIQFPVVAVRRDDNYELDDSTRNYTKLHTGISTTFDNKENNFYNERSIPIKLSYELSVFTTNMEDMDEIVRELLFKYLSMYFLTIQVPYESKRKIRFGVVADIGSGINVDSTSSTYISEGKLYGCSIKLNCEGCVLLHYTPVKLTRMKTETHILNPSVDYDDSL